MNRFEALGMARMLIDAAKRDGRYPAGVVESTTTRRRQRKNFCLVYGRRLEREIVEADALIGFVSETTSEDALADMILEAL